VCLTVIGGAGLAFLRDRSLTPAEIVWCRSHARDVAAANATLDLAPPSATISWDDWAVVSENMVDGWDLLDPARKADRDRACRAAFEARTSG
jgi:hypothetical protein